VRLGAKANLSEDTIREFENGRRIPGLGNLTRIRQPWKQAVLSLPMERRR